MSLEIVEHSRDEKDSNFSIFSSLRSVWKLLKPQVDNCFYRKSFFSPIGLNKESRKSKYVPWGFLWIFFVARIRRWYGICFCRKRKNSFSLNIF
jgi:hypothetical protein